MKNDIDIDSYLFSSPSDLIRKHLEMTHQISESMLDNSTIYEFVQTKSRELLLYKEKILEMEAQIKILRETLSLQSAEFTFQRSEYEKEIDQLRKNLNIHISSKAKYATESEIDLSLKTENENLQKKYSKWKQKAKSEKQKFEETDAKLNKTKNTLKIIVAKYRSLHSRFVSLREKSTNNNNNSDNLLGHIEEERESVYEMLGIQQDDISGKWNNLNEKCTSMIQKIDELEKNNEKLNKRLTNALETIKQNQKKEIIVEPNNDSIENVNLSNQAKSKISTNSSPASSSSLHSALISTPNHQNSVLISQSSPKQQNSASAIFNENEKSNDKNESTKLIPATFRSQFIISIDKLYFNFYKQLNGLHDALIPNERTNLRSIFLAVIFIIRFKHSFSLPFDPTALSFFYGKEEISSQNKINEICQKFTELTRDLLVAKQNYADSEREKNELNNKLNEIHEQETSKKTLEMKIECYKKRMIELQEYLSTLISPEQYQEARFRVNSLEEENRELQEKYKSMQKLVDDANYNSIDVANQIENLTICANVKTQEAHEMRLQCASKDDRIEALNAIIHEKTKEIISLEKMLKNQKMRNETASSNLECLTIENQSLIQEQKNKEQFKSDQINPAFLVKK